MTQRATRVAAALVAAALIVTACGGDDDSSQPEDNEPSQTTSDTALDATTEVEATEPETTEPETTQPPPAGDGSVAPDDESIDESAEWDAVVAAAKEEGEVIWSTFESSPDIDEVARAFEDEYGITVRVVATPTPEFTARLESELAAGRQSVDVRTGGSPTTRRLDANGQTEDPGHLPVMDEPASSFAVDPFIDIKDGVGFGVHYSMQPYYLLANNELCPEDNCPSSYEELADPAYDGMILLSEPTGPSPGTRLVAYGVEEYGEEWLAGMIDNVAALNSNISDAQRQVARGEFALYAQSGPPIEIWDLPEPRPFRLIDPSDGNMVTTSGAAVVAEAPHPNAARLLINYLLSKAGQEVMASVLGAPIIRTDVEPVDPELVAIPSRLFPGNPDTFEFGSTYTSYTELSDPLLVEAGLK